MANGRRVGTYTAGVTLILFGTLFMLRPFVPLISYRLILTLWPLILILLGVEIILSGVFNRKEALRYDGGAIFLSFILTVFAMMMGFIQFAMENAPLTGTFRL